MLKKITAIPSLMVGLMVFGCGNGGGSNSPTATTTAAPSPVVVTVEIFENEYRPKSITIQAGQMVRWVHRGADPTHTSTAKDGAWDSGLVFTQPGATFERTFGGGDDGRTFEYACTAHSNCCDMKGSIRVGASSPPPEPGY